MEGAGDILFTNHICRDRAVRSKNRLMKLNYPTVQDVTTTFTGTSEYIHSLVDTAPSRRTNQNKVHLDEINYRTLVNQTLLSLIGLDIPVAASTISSLTTSGVRARSRAVYPAIVFSSMFIPYSSRTFTTPTRPLEAAK